MSFVQSVHLSVPQKTQSGNDYNKSNYCKFAGTTLGLGAGAKLLYMSNQIKNDSKFVETIKTIVPEVVEKLSETFAEPKLTAQEINEEIPKVMKKFYNRTIVGVAVALGVLGLGVGTIGDSIINHFKKKNADKDNVE